VEAANEIGHILSDYITSATFKYKDIVAERAGAINSLKKGEKLELFLGFTIARKQDGSLFCTGDDMANQIGARHYKRIKFGGEEDTQSTIIPTFSEEDDPAKRKKITSSKPRIFGIYDPVDVTGSYLFRLTGGTGDKAKHYTSNLVIVVDGIPFIAALRAHEHNFIIRADGRPASIIKGNNSQTTTGEIELPYASEEFPENDLIRIAISYRDDADKEVRKLFEPHFEIDVVRNGGALRVSDVCRGFAQVAFSKEGLKWWDVGANIAIALSLGHCVAIPHGHEMPSIYDSEASLPPMYFGPRAIMEKVGLQIVFSPEQYREVLERHGNRIQNFRLPTDVTERA
jgi:hypothetical protein